MLVLSKELIRLDEDCEMDDHTGAIINWKRAELKTMNLLTEGTSRAVLSGASKSLTGI